MTSGAFQVRNWIIPAVFCSVLILLDIVILTHAINRNDDGVSAGRHLHRHHHHHHHRQSDDSGDETDDFVPAYRTVSKEILSTRNNEGDTEEEKESSTSSIERRLQHLEQEVVSLCLEDEDDLERRIRELNVRCVCPKTEAPVCGSDNVTYYNRCFLQCRAQLAEASYHRYKITLKKFGPC